ncbi:hypothetical protein ACFL3G_01145 [Planctomycetota bacterium]
MKKTLLILAVLALAIPAMAETVHITATDINPGSGLVEISYEVTGGSELVRAFALDINVADGNIVDVNNYFVGECNGVEQGYGIFLGRIVIETNGDVNSYGSPLAKTGSPGSQAGLGNDAITIEMGSLYEDGNAPAASGVLCIVECDTLPTYITVTKEDVARGGIVMETVANIPEVNLVDATHILVDGGDDGCTCWGDVSSGATPPGQPDVAVSLSDVFYIYDLIKLYPHTGYVAPLSDANAAGYECADVSSGATPAGQRDEAVSLSDVFHIYDHIKLYPGTGYVGPCMFEDGNGDIQIVVP